MDNYVSLQETFDASVFMPAAHVALFFDIDEVQRKHMDTIKTDGLTHEVLDDYAAVAKKYGLEYEHPKYAAGLRAVETRPTVH